jgi:hypothetical protein
MRVRYKPELTLWDKSRIPGTRIRPAIDFAPSGEFVETAFGLLGRRPVTIFPIPSGVVFLTEWSLFRIASTALCSATHESREFKLPPETRPEARRERPGRPITIGEGLFGLASGKPLGEARNSPKRQGNHSQFTSSVHTGSVAASAPRRLIYPEELS